MKRVEINKPKLPKIGSLGLKAFLIGLLLVILVIKSSVNIGYGEAGVMFKTLSGGVVTDKKPLSEGFHIIAPWNKVFIYNTKQQEKFEKAMKVLSSNGLEISLDISVLYEPEYNKLGKLHQTKGLNYERTVIIPEVRAVTRSVVGRYTPEQLYSTKRDAIQNEIYEETKRKVSGQFVQLNAVLVRNVTLPLKIKDYIEKKLGQEQETLEYKFRIEKAKKEAERQRIDAEGKATANRILSASLTDKILKEKGIEATLELAKSSNSKVVVVGGKDGLPLILGK